MSLKIFNVLGREKQDFQPLEAGKVSMYVCGPTVYSDSHIGHAKTYINFDMVVRYLRYSGLQVLYVQNITDVGHLLDTGEDRILRKAQQTQALPMQIVETYARGYYADMDRLGVTRADIAPRASAHIPEQIKMTQTLIDKGHAYVADGSVYFDVTTDENYGKLSNRRVTELEAGAREAVRDEKRHPEDFALWKRAEPEHILRWDSPWGEGFPGWHIECSAMAKKYLGDTFDIHGGGVDNIFPHNECEIAQSECANDADFARYWMLTGSLTVDGVKMSKSLGNVVNIKDALRDYRPEVIRMFMLSAHYSNPVDYSDGALDGAQAGWERLYGAVRLTRNALNNAPTSDDGNSFSERLAKAKEEFAAVMDDDFNAPMALGALQTLTGEVNKLLNESANVNKSTLEAIDTLYADLGGKVLGIVPTVESQSGDQHREDGLIQLLIQLRKQSRDEKNYARSDQIRDQLKALGVTLEDRADGTVYKLD